ncbi:MAG: transcriptional regulator [Acidimicrobiia bacterium]
MTSPTVPSSGSDRGFRVLHTLRCIGVVGEDRLAIASGLEPAEAASALRDLARRGLVSHDPGPFGGWSMTDTGRSTGLRWVTEELVASGTAHDVENAYQLFLRLNPLVLDVCRDWQMQIVAGAPVLNDHTDVEHDAGVIDRLMRLDGEAQRLLDPLAGDLPRFGVYKTRLASALRRVMAGDNGYLTDEVESYHAVWFQLHEDFLVTLGLSREGGAVQ